MSARPLGSAPQESILSDDAYYLKCIGGLLVGASGTWRVEKTGSKASVIESLGFRSVVPHGACPCSLAPPEAIFHSACLSAAVLCLTVRHAPTPLCLTYDLWSTR
jgi:hypothetical protein